MPSVQFVIDNICASVTVECVYTMIEGLVAQGSFKMDEMIPLIQTKDRSLDVASAKMIAQAAVEDMAKRGLIRMEGDNVYIA